MNQEQFEQRFSFRSADYEAYNLFQQLKRVVTCKKLAKKSLSCFPIFTWLSKYSVKQNLHGDLITGLTVGIMVVPQGMAYASLAGLAPIYGLYSCFFAAFIYMFFGTSRHISVGTFAVASMMVGVVQNDLLSNSSLNSNVVGNETTVSNHNTVNNILEFELTPIVITTSLTFFVGICQLIMGMLRLSFLTNYISDPLVSGFTTGSAVHVLFSQLEKALGVHTKRQSGFGLIIKMFIELISALPRVNPWTLAITAFGLTFLSVGRDYINPWFKARYRIPLPLELILVIVSLAFSKIFDVSNNYGVAIVANVPRGIPTPALPKLQLFSYLWRDAISIAVVSYIFVFSMGKIFAKKHKYKVDPNQELYALGIAEVLSSFFPVYPCGASLSRSSLCEMTGAKTQLHALFSSGLLLIVILYIGPFLEPLPMASLACIVIVSLKNLFLQVSDLPKLWRISYADFFLWIIVFITTTFVDVTIGLVVGIVFVIFSVVLREQWPTIERLGSTPGKDIFRPTQLYKDLISTSEFGRVIILKFEAPLHFANISRFIQQSNDAMAEISSNLLLKTIDTRTLIENGKIEEMKSETTHNNSILNVPNMNETTDVETPPSNQPYMESERIADTRKKLITTDCIGFLIVDASSISFIDSSGVDALIEIFNDGHHASIEVKFANFSDKILAILTKCNFFATVPKSNFYPTVREAFLMFEQYRKMSLKATT